MTTTTRKSRPNANYILAVMRDDDFSDPWGTGMEWAHACAEVIYDADPNAVPVGLDYRPAMAGTQTPGMIYGDTGAVANPKDLPWATVVVWEYLWNVEASTLEDWTDYANLPAFGNPGFDHRFAEVLFAARCLDRYLDWCKSAGRDY